MARWNGGGHPPRRWVQPEALSHGRVHPPLTIGRVALELVGGDPVAAFDINLFTVDFKESAAKLRINHSINGPNTDLNGRLCSGSVRLTRDGKGEICRVEVRPSTVSVWPPQRYVGHMNLANCGLGRAIRLECEREGGRCNRDVVRVDEIELENPRHGLTTTVHQTSNRLDRRSCGWTQVRRRRTGWCGCYGQRAHVRVGDYDVRCKLEGHCIPQPCVSVRGGLAPIPSCGSVPHHNTRTHTPARTTHTHPRAHARAGTHNRVGHTVSSYCWRGGETRRGGSRSGGRGTVQVRRASLPCINCIIAGFRAI